MGKGSKRGARVPVDLERVRLFAGCRAGERELIARMATVTELAAGVVLCAEGERGEAFCVVVSGEVAVSIAGRRIAVLGSGCGFGEMALLERGGRHVADVITSTPVVLVVFSRPEFATLMAEVPRLAWAVVGESRRRQAELAASAGSSADR